MKERLVKIFFASAIGAFLGALVAKNAGVFWPGGIILGSIIGYFIYEYKEVIQTLRSVAPTIWEEMRKKRKIKTDWKTFKLKLKGACKESFVICFSLIHTCFWVLITMCLLHSTITDKKSLAGIQEEGVLRFFLTLEIGILVLLSLTFLIGIICVYFSSDYDLTDTEKVNEDCKKYLKMGPHMIFVYWPLWGAWFIATKIPLVLTFIGKVIWETILIVHKEPRIICMLGATMGAYVGYAMQNPFYPWIGAIVGGLFGLLEAYVVGIKILKVFPQNGH